MEYSNQAKFLRERREKTGKTQWDISKALGFSTAQFISNIERKKAGIPPTLVGSISKILKVKSTDIVDVILKDYRVDLIRLSMEKKKNEKSKATSKSK